MVSRVAWLILILHGARLPLIIVLRVSRIVYLLDLASGGVTVPTIGDMLHMTEDGRFTTGGKGGSVSEEFKRREREAHKNDQVRLLDAGGRLCGYLTMSQVWSLPEQFLVADDDAHASEAIAKERRLSLLRLSYANGTMTPQQNAEVSMAIDAIINPKARANKHQRKESESGERFVTRDVRGMFLGVFTIKEAQERWPIAKRYHEMIHVGATFEFSQAYEAASSSNSNRCVFNNERVRSSIDVARRHLATLAGSSVEDYWRESERRNKKVYYKADKPLCNVPLYVIRDVFGMDWFDVSDDSVQIVRRYAAKDISALMIAALVRSGQLVVEPSRQKHEPTTQHAVRQSMKSKPRATNTPQRAYSLFTASSSSPYSATTSDGLPKVNPDNFANGFIVAEKTSLSDLGSREFSLKTRRGTFLQHCSFDELVALAGRDKAEAIRQSETRRLIEKRDRKLAREREERARREQEKASSEAKQSSTVTEDSNTSRDLRSDKDAGSSTVRSSSTAKASTKRAPERPSVNKLLQELGVPDDVARTVARLVTAYRSLGRSIELQRYARIGLNELKGVAELGILEEMDPTRIAAIAAMPNSGVSVDIQRSALLVIGRGILAYRSTEKREKTRNILKQSHMFVFDEDAYQVASSCSIPLSRLPYQTCLVENVLLTSRYGQIEVRALAKGADTEVAKRLMAFVVSCCTENRVSKSKTNYVSIKPVEGDKDKGQVARRAHARRGHWRNQPYGPGQSLRKLIWIDDTIVSESYGISAGDIKQVHRVSLRRGTSSGTISGVEI